jgi:hypothetical protein
MLNPGQEPSPNQRAQVWIRAGSGDDELNAVVSVWVIEMFTCLHAVLGKAREGLRRVSPRTRANRIGRAKFGLSTSSDQASPEGYTIHSIAYGMGFEMVREALSVMVARSCWALS